MTTKVSGQQVPKQEQPKETKPKEERLFCLGCRKVTRFIKEGCLRVCQGCGTVGRTDRGADE